MLLPGRELWQVIAYQFMRLKKRGARCAERYKLSRSSHGIAKGAVHVVVGEVWPEGNQSPFISMTMVVHLKNSAFPGYGIGLPLDPVSIII